MRNFKKFLALVLAMLMVVSAAATVSAFSDVAEDNQYNAAIADLVEKGIVNGVGDDKFNPDGAVERYQMALMMARALDPDKTNEEWAEGMSIFTDVTEWYGAINYAYMNGIVTGIGNLQFAPHAGIRYQDALIMALRALGYTVDVSGDPYWLAAYNQAAKIGLTKNVAVNKGDKTLTRAETAQVIYNMLYTTPADGGATIAAKNFGEATVANTTTFVITATPKQAYAESYKAAEDGYVGIQQLVNGLPSGDVMYVPAILLGIDDDAIENYFSYSVGLVNYDAKTGKFDRAIMGADPVIAYNSEITKNSSSKITYNGVAYYPVEQITGAALKNEIVIFNGGLFSQAAKMLLTNKNGDIVNYSGEVVATFAYQTPTGAKYYVDQTSYSKKEVISEATALERFGVKVADGSYTKYATLKVDDLKNNYRLSLFDDNGDGKFDRAIISDVYLSVFTPKGGDGKEDVAGPMYDQKGVTYTKDLTKGDVFTYVYNDQTKVVTVLDVIEAQYKTLTKINTTSNNSNGGYAVKLTIDGEVYTLGNAKREAAGLTGANIYSKNNNISVDKISSDIGIGYTYDSDASWMSLVVGQPIKFYALGDTVIMAKSYKLEDNYDRVVLKELVSYDSNAVYADLYMNGKLVEDVAVTKIDGKTVSGLNVFQLSRLLSDTTLFATGNVFRAVKLSDGTYQLSEALVRNGRDNNLAKFALTTETFGSLITFDDGIADIYNNSGIITGSRVLRTKDSTVFYFLKKDDNGKITSISTYVGAPNKSSIDFSSETGRNIELYADKIGYGSGDYNGIANFVLVYYTNADDIKGFGVANVEYTIAYIVDNKDKVVAYDMASAAELGLTGTEYTGKYFYAYSSDGLAVDMLNGNKINTIYSEKPIAENSFVVLSSDNVVLKDKTPTVEKAALNVASFNQTRYYTIKDATGKVIAQYPTEKVSTVKLTKSTGIDVKTDAPKDVLGDATKTVAYIKDFEDGSFVGVSYEDSTLTPVTPTSGTKYTCKNGTSSSGTNPVTIKAADSKKLAFDLTVYEADGTPSVATSKVITGVKTTELLKGGDPKFALASGEKAHIITNKDGVFSIVVGTKDFSGTYAKELEAGKYQLTVVFESSDSVTRTLVYEFEVK